MIIADELKNVQVELAELKETIRKRNDELGIPQFTDYAGEIFDAIRRAGFLPTTTDPWALQNSVVRYDFERALRRGCSDV